MSVTEDISFSLRLSLLFFFFKKIEEILFKLAFWDNRLLLKKRECWRQGSTEYFQEKA